MNIEVATLMNHGCAAEGGGEGGRDYPLSTEFVG